MKNLYLNQHLGLGDQIICNGLTRILSKKYNTIFLFTYSHNIPSIQFMYRDLGDKIKLIKVNNSDDWYEHLKFIDSYKSIFIHDDHIRIGYNYLNNTNLSFDRAFYEQMSIPFFERFNSFFVERDLNSEKSLFKKLGIKEKNYILVCDLCSIGKCDINFKENTKYKDAKVVHLQKLTPNIFDWIYTAENALEIHTVDSAFKSMIDSFKLNNDLFFYIIRNKKDYTTSQNNWKIIE